MTLSNPTRISDALGGDEGLRRLDSALTNGGLGQLLDVVPNHVCIAERANTRWWDVLRTGRSSAYARFFDIDWDAPGLQERVLLPVLGAPRDEVLAARGLTVVAAPDGGFELHYEGSAFPLAKETAATVGPVTQEILNAQHYIVEFFKTGSARLNYRRFFDVSSLAGVRVEDEPVFDWTLTRALDLVEDGTVDGLRVDHIDGLREPAAFASHLRSRAPSAWLIAEKILASGEEMPVEWPIDGTTGYEFGALLTSLLIHPDGLAALTDCYRQFTGDEFDFATHSHRARREVMQTLLRAELGRLARVASAAGIDSAQSSSSSSSRGCRGTGPTRNRMPRSRLTISARSTSLNAGRGSSGAATTPVSMRCLRCCVATRRGGRGGSCASAFSRSRVRSWPGS